MKQFIPHLITLTSLCIGFYSIIESAKINFNTASHLIIISFILDGLDGFLARYFNTQSNFGKQLDSFSDFVNFGLAPGFLLFFYMNEEVGLQNTSYLAVLIPIFSTIRLANFNTKEKNTDNFSGLTTPANALIFISIPLINQFNNLSWINQFLNLPEIISLLIVVNSMLLIAPIKTFGLRIDNILLNKRKMTFVFISICILYIFKYIGILIVTLLYILASIFRIIDK
ncbi:MAG: CDP-diacylglycerol--serine O-phosphatidyltransferase [Flavobacteriales bacterium]|nr:CDP-diacylglycerol--serine O-phosphatidyltransferase [Flavobacteriales bacterium]